MENDFAARNLFIRGKMPSAFVALISSLMATAVLVDGIGSSVAGLALAMGAAVLVESLLVQSNLKRLEQTAMGLLSKPAAEKLAGQIPSSDRRDIAAGALIGSAAALALTVSHWRGEAGWLFRGPSDGEASVYLFVFLGLLAAGALVSAWLGRLEMRKLPTSSQLRRTIRLNVVLPAAAGALAGLTDVQRIWIALVVVWIIAGNLRAYLKTYRRAKERLAEESRHFGSGKTGRPKRRRTKPKTRRKQ
jgi:acid phosphatase family membrane protein YuiD